MNQNINRGPPHVAELRAHRRVQVSLKITVFRLDDLVQGLGHVGIKRRDQTRKHLDSHLADLIGVKAQIVAAQGPDAENLEIAFQPVVKHGQFIQPKCAHEFAPPGDPEIVLEFSPLLKAVGGVNVLLQKFRIGKHGPEFIHV